MKNNITELVFILDRSGSMSGLESDTIGGFNSMIERQKKVNGTCYVTTVLFDTRIDRIHDRVDLEQIRPMTERLSAGRLHGAAGCDGKHDRPHRAYPQVCATGGCA